MVDLPGGLGANKGFWMQQLRDKYGKFVEMGGDVSFEINLDGVDGPVFGIGKFIGMLDLDTARIEVGDNSRVPRGVYYVERNKITAVKAVLDKDFVEEQTQEAIESVNIPEPELVKSLTGDEVQRKKLSTVAKMLKARGRFPMPRLSKLSERGGNSDIAMAAKIDYQKVYDKEPGLQEKYGSFDAFWTQVFEYSTDERTQSPNELAAIPQEMKDINRAYAKHVLGLDPDGTITVYRNAVNAKFTEQDSAVGYVSTDRDMAYDYNSHRENIEANGRYEIDVKPDEVYGMLGYSKIEDEFGLTIGQEVANIPGRVRRVGDLAPIDLNAPWMQKYGREQFIRARGQTPFRNFNFNGQYDLHPVDPLGDTLNDFLAKHGKTTADIKAKYDQLYGQGAYDAYKAIGENIVSYQDIKKLFVDVGDGKVGLDGARLATYDTLDDSDKYMLDRFDNTMKMLSVIQELSGQYFMTYRTRDYTPVESNIEEAKESEIKVVSSYNKEMVDIDARTGSEALLEILDDAAKAAKESGGEGDYEVDEDTGGILVDYQDQRATELGYIDKYLESFVRGWPSSFDYVNDVNDEFKKILNNEIQIDPKNYSKLSYTTREVIAGLELIQATPKIEETMYRGIRTTKETVDKYIEGAIVDLPFSSFSVGRGEAAQYWNMPRNDVEGGGFPVEYELIPGSRSIPLTAFDTQAVIGEYVSAGRYEIVSVEKSDDLSIPTKVKIKHVAIFNPDLQDSKELVEPSAPTGQTGIFKDYSPDNSQVAAENTPLTDLGFDPEQEITVYRGVPEGAEGINPGDWVTTLPQLAKDYAGGGGKVVSMKVKAKDLLADPSSGEGAYTEEMVYRPAAPTREPFKYNPELSPMQNLGMAEIPATMDAGGVRLPTPGAFTGKFRDLVAGAKSWKEVKDIIDDQEIIYFDFETTGISDYDGSPVKNDPVQLGAVKVKNGKVIDRFNVYINPGSPLSEWSAANLVRDEEDGSTVPLTDEWLSTQLSVRDALQRFLVFAGKEPLLGGQNVPFDLEILQRMGRKSGLNFTVGGTIDSKGFAESLIPKYDPANGVDGPKTLDKKTGEYRATSSLGPVAEFLGFEPTRWHSADGDALDSFNIADRAMQLAVDRENSDLSLLDFDSIDAEYQKKLAKYQEAVDPFGPPTETQMKVFSELETSLGLSGEEGSKYKERLMKSRAEAARVLQELEKLKGQIDYSRWVDYLDELFASLNPEFQDASLNQELLSKVIEKAGFNAKPQLVPTPDWIDKDRAIYRGLSTKEHRNAFLTDEIQYSGLGIYGNGSYFASNKNTAEIYAAGGRSSESVYPPADEMNRRMLVAQIAGDAKILKFKNEKEIVAWTNAQIELIIQEYRKKHNNNPEMESKIRNFLSFNRNNNSLVAVMAGYDGFTVDRMVEDLSIYYVILNRGALMIAENSSSTPPSVDNNKNDESAGPQYEGTEGLAEVGKWREYALGERTNIKPGDEPGTRWNRYTAVIPVDVLLKFAEYDRTVTKKFDDTPELIESLAKELQEGGYEAIREPLQISYDPKNKWGVLVEGNHRLAAAIKAGVTHLPVTVYVTRDHLANKRARIGASLNVDNRIVEETGYIPDLIHPGNFKEFENYR